MAPYWSSCLFAVAVPALARDPFQPQTFHDSPISYWALVVRKVFKAEKYQSHLLMMKWRWKALVSNSAGFRPGKSYQRFLFGNQVMNMAAVPLLGSLSD